MDVFEKFFYIVCDLESRVVRGVISAFDFLFVPVFIVVVSSFLLQTLGLLTCFALLLGHLLLGLLLLVCGRLTGWIVIHGVDFVIFFV
jgi:hypothetical protein